MRIATWNVNGLRARLDFVLHWLEARKPDLVGIQELKADAGEFPARELADAGYRTFAHTQKAWNGVAVLARAEGETFRKGLDGQEDQGARLIAVDFPDLRFVTLYGPNGKSVGHGDFFRKLTWFESLADFLRTTCDPSKPLVVCGDFNVCPTPLDSWNEELLRGKIFHTEQERDRFQTLLEWGLRDVFRHRHPDRKEFSWWDYRAGAFHKNQGLRIDFLLATEPVLERVLHVEIDRDYRKKKDGLIASDHAPVIADLD